MSTEDNFLVQRIRNKDKRAFEMIYNQYFSLLVSYAFRFLDTIEEAEEVVQEVFVKFWDKCDTLAEDSSVKNYLYRSVHNTCLNQIKHQKVKDHYKDYVIHFMESTESLHLEDSQAPDKMKRIMAEIEKLPPRCSEIFKLSRLEGLKYQEIADHMDISIKTVEVQMGKALRVLRENLRDLKMND